MKIVNRKQFLEMPEYTMYRTVEGSDFDDLRVKMKTLGDNCWYYLTFYWLDFGEDADWWMEDSMLISQALEDPTIELIPDFECTMRDSLFNKDQMFAIYTKEEVQKLIKILNKCK